MLRRRMLLLPLAAGAISLGALAGCGGDDEAAEQPAPAPAAAPAPSPAEPAAAPAKQPVLTGVADGEPVTYLDFGEIALEPGNALGGMWVVTNGAEGQGAIFDSLPGVDGYSALRAVSEVAWASDATPRVLASTADVAAAETAGEVVVAATDRVVNAPLLELGQERHAGYAKGETIEYYELGVIAVAPGNEVLPIWTFTNGVEGQRNIADTEPGTTAYTPLWAPVEVTWNEAATPRLITSFDELEAAEAAGEVTLAPVPDTVVNCPFL